jgi:carboxylesterase
MSAAGDTETAAPAGLDAEPFDLAPDSRDAVLCLHGLTATPYEVRGIGEALAARGIRAFGPATPGHNTTIEDLIDTPYTAWLDSARQHCDTLRERHERVFAVGMSMGALLSLDLAADGRADAVVSIGAPLRLGIAIRTLVPGVKRVWKGPKKGGSDIRDPAARARHPGYPIMPLHAVHELIRLQVHVEAKLEEVRAPILVAHGALDKTANPADAREIFDRVGSTDKQLLMLEKSGHVVTVDYDGEEVSRVGAEFLTRFVTSQV